MENVPHIFWETQEIFKFLLGGCVSGAWNRCQRLLLPFNTSKCQIRRKCNGKRNFSPLSLTHSERKIHLYKVLTKFQEWKTSFFLRNQKQQHFLDMETWRVSVFSPGLFTESHESFHKDFCCCCVSMKSREEENKEEMKTIFVEMVTRRSHTFPAVPKQTAALFSLIAVVSKRGSLSLDPFRKPIS